MDVTYWKERCVAVERRMDQLEREIRRLKGCKPMEPKDITIDYKTLQVEDIIDGTRCSVSMALRIDAIYDPETGVIKIELWPLDHQITLTN